ncbi:MAG: hypothetical protein QOH80_1455 [Actinomycetota bacterium]|nr:hypothetical protein [Actinomycetota bacterium]
MTRPFLAIPVAAAIALVPVAAVSTSAHERPALPPDTYVAAWDAIGSAAFTAAAVPGSGLGPPEGHLIFGYVGIAEYDAVMAVHQDYRPFAINDTAPRGTSPEAAVAAAAHKVFVHYLPSQTTMLDSAYTTSLGTIDDGQAKTDGVALGERVANALLALRADDGFRAPATYTPPDPPIPGVFLPTAPTPAGGTYLPAMRPFTLRSADQFRLDGPPALTSKTYARDYNEVKDLGSAASTTRTAAQTETALFWGEPPVQQAHGAFSKFVRDHELNIVEAVRFMAMETVTYADAFLACFDSKYHFKFWRPITAIRAGDTDGNDDTLVDTGWTPMLPTTPNHPDYPSAHSCITPASGLVIERFLGTRNIDFTVPSLRGAEHDRYFATSKALGVDVRNGRVWGGIHFRSAVEDGSDIAKQVADYVLDRNFKKEHG